VKTRFLLLLTAGVACAATTPDQVHIRPARTVVVGEHSVVDVYVAPLVSTLLCLPVQEHVREVIGGDSADWQVKAASRQQTRYVSVKLQTDDPVTTDLTVISDHDKPYTFRLISSVKEADSKVFIDPDSQLSQDLKQPAPWVPRSEEDEWKRKAESAQAELAQTPAKIDAAVAHYPHTMRLYQFDPKKARKLGIEVAFHDDKTTRILAYAHHAATLVYDGKPMAVQFQDGVYTVPQVLDRFFLVSGNTKLEFVPEGRR
jgi:hypothetical protein